MRRLAIAWLLVMFAGGCSGHIGTGNLPAVPAYQAAPTANITIAIKWPSSAQSGANPAFISPSAQSVTVAVNGTLIATINAPPPGQPSQAVTAAAPLGSDVFSMKTYDGANATGTMLGQVDETFTVADGQANNIALTVIGIATSIAVVPEPNQPLLLGDAVSGYRIAGNRGVVFDVTLKDADGNTILNGGQPPLGVSGNQNLFFSYDDPSLNVIRAVSTNGINGYDQVVLTAFNPDGSQISAPPIKIGNTEIVAVIDGGSTPRVSLYDLNGNAIPLPAGRFGGLTQPSGLTYDPCLFTFAITDSASNSLNFYAEDGGPPAYTPGPFLPALNNPTALTFEPLNQTYVVANAGTATLNFYTYFYQGVTFNGYPLGSFVPTALSCLQSCPGYVMASDPGNAVMVINGSDQIVWQDGPPHVNHPSSVVPILLPQPERNYITNRGNNTVTIYDDSGHIMTPSGTFPGLSQPTSMTFSNRGYLYVTNYGSNSVTKYDLNGNQQPLSGFSGLNAPTYIRVVNIGQCYG
jgi:hypothetical protein